MSRLNARLKMYLSEIYYKHKLEKKGRGLTKKATTFFTTLITFLKKNLETKLWVLISENALNLN